MFSGLVSYALGLHVIIFVLHHVIPSIASPMHPFYFCTIFMHIGSEKAPLEEFVILRKENPREQ
jgi:hypothetical protein